MFKKQLMAVRIAALVPTLVFASSATLAASAVVKNVDQLRAALTAKKDKIIIQSKGKQIEIDETLVYDAEAPLTIIGGGTTIQGTGDFTLLEVMQGANLTIKNLHFQGIGGFDVENQSEGRGKGVFVDVPKDRTGTVRLVLTNVSVRDVGYHGVHVSDCDGGDSCGSGGESGGNGSPASVHADLKNVVIENVGYGVFDGDGLRIDERDDGDIVLKIANAEFVGVGADGVELDEDGDGDVIVKVRNSHFDMNGGYCDPNVIDPEKPPYADPMCVEDDDGDLVLDLDDGFDIDEAGIGSIWVSIKSASVDDNLDEGLDFDEVGAGDIELDLANVHGARNGDEAVKASEEDDGDVTADLRSVTAIENGDDGIQIEETGVGDVHADLRAVDALDNEDSGIEVTQGDVGELAVMVSGSVATGNDDSDLKVESEGDGGTLKVRGSDIGTVETDNVDET